MKRYRRGTFPATAPSVTIADRVLMPILGLGTWQARGDEAYAAVCTALDVGYRHIDTATAYGNEGTIGRAVRDSGLARDDIFITTKMPPENAGRERSTIEASLTAMGLDHVDLWLVHWPPGGKARPKTWQQFIAARDAGLTRAIGVSNYSTAQIDELTAATGVSPAVNQIKWGPALYDAYTEQAHRARGVMLEGWSPFLSTDLDHPVLVEIAQRHGVTTRQVVLRWHIDHATVVIPKSSDPGRIAHNFDVFDFTLEADELARIDALGEDRLSARASLLARRPRRASGSGFGVSRRRRRSGDLGRGDTNDHFRRFGMASVPGSA